MIGNALGLVVSGEEEEEEEEEKEEEKGEGKEKELLSQGKV